MEAEPAPELSGRDESRSGWTGCWAMWAGCPHPAAMMPRPGGGTRAHKTILIATQGRSRTIEAFRSQWSRAAATPLPRMLCALETGPGRSRARWFSGGANPPHGGIPGTGGGCCNEKTRSAPRLALGAGRAGEGQRLAGRAKRPLSAGDEAGRRPAPPPTCARTSPAGNRSIPPEDLRALLE